MKADINNAGLGVGVVFVTAPFDSLWKNKVLNALSVKQTKHEYRVSSTVVVVVVLKW